MAWRRLMAAAAAAGGLLAAAPPAAAFTDLRPDNWAYQALQTLMATHGCPAGTAEGGFAGGRAISRQEAAALLSACLGQVSELTDSEQRLIAILEPELAALRGRSDGLDARLGELEATAFSTTTRLSGQAAMVLGANGFDGSARRLVRANRRAFGATTLNVDVQLRLDTSFSGEDLLRTTLRSGNFDLARNSFYGAGPSSLSTLETAFQEEAGGTVTGIDKLFFQTPIGAGFTVTLGGRVAQEDMLALWPSAYPDSSVLDVLTAAGAPGAYNYNLGPGGGLWWKSASGFSASASYVASNAADGAPASGGLGSSGAGSSGTVQVAYGKERWGVAALWSRVANGHDTIVYGSPFLLRSYRRPGHTDAYGLSGFWQPAGSGWIPSISGGWGLNSSSYAHRPPAGAVLTSQSWSVGLQWLDALGKGNSAGLALGQAPFATALRGNRTPDDAGTVGECWLKWQLSDAISITPALFHLSRPLGQRTPAGRSFSQLGALVKMVFTF